jgi:hypothetical protein
VDWEALGRSVLTAIVASGIVLAGIRFWVEKRLEYSFDRRLKEYEAQLTERSQVRIQYGTDRLAGYQRLVMTINVARRAFRTYLEEGEPTDTSRLDAAVREFENALYENTVVLTNDNLYEEVHKCKNTLWSLVGQIDNARRTDREDPERAESIRLDVRNQVPKAILDAETVLDKLNEALRSLA